MTDTTDKILKDTLQANAQAFWERLEGAAARAGRKATDITVIPAVKGQSPELINCLYELGFDTVGENRSDEVEAKRPLLRPEISVQFIGRLQTNKVRRIIDKVSMVQSLDRPSLAAELNKRALALGLVMPVLVEVNMGDEDTKGGVAPCDAKDFVSLIKDGYPALKVSGIMCVMPIAADAKLYLQAVKLYDILSNTGGADFRYLSMGMSEDFVTAVECGANMIRPGRVLVGARPV